MLIWENEELLGRIAMTNHLDNVLKSRNTNLPNIVKAVVFLVIMYECESWAIKKAERWRTDIFKCGAGQDSWEFLGQQGDQTSQS